MAEHCFAFSEMVTPAAAAIFGNFAERKITDKYLKDVGRFKTGDQQNFFPFNVKDFHDPANTWSRTGLLGEFIMTHNRGKISESEWKRLQLMGGMLKVPDLMTHDAVRREYYEIKPASPDGNIEGLAKCAILDALFARYHLPYKGGTLWNPSERELITTHFVWGTQVEFYLHYFRDGRGLIFYELCAKGDFAEIMAKVGIAVFVAALVVAFLAVIPKPIPV